MTKIKDIVNRDLVNLENCESEPIHIPGSIQPHGFLIALKKDSWLIDFCTENTEAFIHIPYTALLGKSFESVFGNTEGKKLKDYITDPSSDFSKPHVFTWNAIEYNTIIHQSGDLWLMDIEPFPDGSLTLPDLYSQTKRFVSHLEKSISLQDLCQVIANETRLITGYDRVMIYRFDKDYNGEVFAESKRDDLESFFGLHYPHTDIPVQARALYMRNLMRIIVDVNYTPVPIYTVDDVKNKKLDLSDSVLRSVSPIHVEYLQNIGVGATLTISLIHNKKLWGLIACHHYSAKNLPHYTRLAAQLQGHFLTSQINVREVAEEFDTSQLIHASLERLLKHVTEVSTGNFGKILDKDILDITNSSGLAFVFEGAIHTYGQAPEEKEIRALISWLSKMYPKGFYSSAKLVNDYPDAAKIHELASGILFHSLGTTEEDCIIWFRQEVKKTVNWAGDPNKAIIKNEKGLSPRKSFELWKEITKYQSEDWEEIELDAAAKFAGALQKQTYLLYLTKEEIKYRLLSEKLQKANSELENINWISNHDLKEPLRKIQLFASRLLDDDTVVLQESVTGSVQRMFDFAKRMQTLLNDLMSYSRMRDLSEVMEEIDLEFLLEEIKRELKEEIEEHSVTIRYNSLPKVKGISFQIHQLFLNLIRNSIKFSRETTPPVIEVSYEKITAPHEIQSLDNFSDYYRVRVQDNGIGFNNEYADSMFNVFKRLHNSKKYTGTGIGLAICKKIMENHEGMITASGVINEGSCFDLYFPVSKS